MLGRERVRLAPPGFNDRQQRRVDATHSIIHVSSSSGNNSSNDNNNNNNNDDDDDDDDGNNRSIISAWCVYGHIRY
jgi:hypothetical protein